MRDVILHAFNWSYLEIAEKARDIGEIGYGSVLLPPPLYSDPNGNEWWQRYQPKDYRVLKSFLGNKQQLMEAIKALHAEKVRVYAELVFSHMANENRPDCLNFPGASEVSKFSAEQDSFEVDRLYGNLDTSLFSPWDFHSLGNIQNWMDEYQSEEFSLSGLPDLELNDWVIGQQQNCLRELNTMGFDGYKVWVVKHLPDEHIIRVLETPDMTGKFLLVDDQIMNDEGVICYYLNATEWPGICTYDFQLHNILRSALLETGSMQNLNDPLALYQPSDRHQKVSFSIRQESVYEDFNRWQILDPIDEFLANVYIFGRNGGIPLVFSDHNENASMHHEDNGRWSDFWFRRETVNMIYFRNVVHGTLQRTLFQNDGSIVFARGDRGIVAINKTTEWEHPRINT